MQASKASETIHRFQIGNLHGENWKSTYLSPHDEISIAGQLGSTEIWFLEKHATEPLWSFYVSLSENLHVECDEAARGTTNPAQELKNRASKFFETFKAATDKLKLELQQKTSQDNEDHQQQQSTDTIHGSHDETSVSETGLASDIVKKYYVTYNKKSDGDANVTLELPHDNDPSMTRYFYAFYQPSGRLRLQPQSTPGKFLGINNCALAVLNEKEIREEHEWVIDFEVTAGSKQGDVETRVTQQGNSRGLISNGAEQGDNIVVGTVNNFNWIISGDGANTFKVPNKKLYIAYATNDGVTFGSTPSEFVLEHTQSTKALTLYLHNHVPKLYFGISGDNSATGTRYLELVSGGNNALGWVFAVDGLPTSAPCCENIDKKNVN